MFDIRVGDHRYTRRSPTVRCQDPARAGPAQAVAFAPSAAPAIAACTIARFSTCGFG